MSLLFKTYYQLTKPGIVYSNAVTAVAGFLLAAKGQINFWLLIETLLGISLVIASACVFNNYLDRHIDNLMARTKKRALPSGLISIRNALVFGTVLGLVGFSFLGRFTNFLTVTLGVIAFVNYIVFYGLTKRKSIHGTLVGTISGAAPIAAGYTAVTNRFDVTALILFLILVFWQMAHFYSIAIYRFNDYKAAGIPVLPVIKGIKTTKIQILLFVIAFILATSSLTLIKTTGYTFLVVSGLVGLGWLGWGLKNYKKENDNRWARKMFFFSLIVIVSLSVLLSVSTFLP